MGDGRGGKRRIIPIVGGRVTGPAFTGKILNVGADWQTIFSSGVAELDTRYAFRTDDGAVSEIITFGYRHGPKDVMRRVAAGEDLEYLEELITACASLKGLYLRSGDAPRTALADPIQPPT